MNTIQNTFTFDDGSSEVKTIGDPEVDSEADPEVGLQLISLEYRTVKSYIKITQMLGR